jgi:hypothetical protein
MDQRSRLRTVSDSASFMREVAVSVNFLELPASTDIVSSNPVFVGRSAEPLVLLPYGSSPAAEPRVTMSNGQTARVVTRTMTIADLQRYAVVANGTIIAMQSVRVSSEPLSIRAVANLGDTVRAVFYKSNGSSNVIDLN